jgi:S-adenosylhomocysteine hydrolase
LKVSNYKIRSCGLAIDELTKAQEEYLKGWEV